MLMNLVEYEDFCKSYKIINDLWNDTESDKLQQKLDKIGDELLDIVDEVVDDVRGKSYEKDYLELTMKYVMVDTEGWSHVIDRLEELKGA